MPEQTKLVDKAEMEQDPYLFAEETVIWEHTCKKEITYEELFKGLKVEK